MDERAALGTATACPTAAPAERPGEPGILIATNSGLAPSSPEVTDSGRFGAALTNGGSNVKPARKMSRPERHLRTRLAFRPCARATPAIDAPGSLQAARTFAFSSALCRRRGADLECIGVHQGIGGHHAHAPVAVKQGGTARRSHVAVEYARFLTVVHSEWRGRQNASRAAPSPQSTDLPPPDKHGGSTIQSTIKFLELRSHSQKTAVPDSRSHSAPGCRAWSAWACLTRIEQYQAAIESGQLLMMVDVPRDRVEEI